MTYPDWLDERPEAEQQLDPAPLRSRRSELRRMTALAHAALPASARDNDRRDLEENVAYDMTDDDVLKRAGAPAFCVAFAFARIVSRRYSTINQDRRTARELRSRLADATRLAHQLFRDFIHFDPSSKKGSLVSDAVEHLEQATKLQPHSPRGATGRRGWAEFKCWIALLAEAWEDMTGRRATVSHDNYLGRRKETFGDFVEFIEYYVTHLLERLGPSWWPTSKSARMSLIDDVLYGKTKKRSERARARRLLSR